MESPLDHSLITLAGGQRHAFNGQQLHVAQHRAAADAQHGGQIVVGRGGLLRDRLRQQAAQVFVVGQGFVETASAPQPAQKLLVRFFAQGVGLGSWRA